MLVFLVFFDGIVEEFPFNPYDEFLLQYPAGYNLKNYLPFSNNRPGVSQGIPYGVKGNNGINFPYSNDLSTYNIYL